MRKNTRQAKYFGSVEDAAYIRAVFISQADTSVKIKLADSLPETSVAKFDAQTPMFF